MDNDNIKKGIIFGIIGVLIVGFQPIIANSRPAILDFYIFAAMTMIVEALIFFPLLLLERRKIRTNYKNKLITFEEKDSLLNGYKKNMLLLIFVGVAFGIGMMLFFIGYQEAGVINGSLAQKSTVIFSLLFGFLILGERISKSQIFFSLVLSFGLILAVTQGSFNLLEFNAGVLIILILSGIWMLGHTLTKPVLDRNEATPILIIFLRNLIGGILLFLTYFLFFPISNLRFFHDPINIFFFIVMGVVYGTGLYCWYQTLSCLDVSKASILVSPTPIITALYAILFFGVFLNIYQLIGTCIVILSIILLFREKESDEKK